MLGIILQVLTVITGLTINWLVSKKKTELKGFFLCFISLPLWVLLEAYYQQWFYLALNPIYMYLYFRAWWSRRQHEKINKG